MYAFPRDNGLNRLGVTRSKVNDHRSHCIHENGSLSSWLMNHFMKHLQTWLIYANFWSRNGGGINPWPCTVEVSSISFSQKIEIISWINFQTSTMYGYWDHNDQIRICGLEVKDYWDYTCKCPFFTISLEHLRVLKLVSSFGKFQKGILLSFNSLTDDIKDCVIKPPWCVGCSNLIHVGVLYNQIVKIVNTASDTACIHVGTGGIPFACINTTKMRHFMTFCFPIFCIFWEQIQILKLLLLCVIVPLPCFVDACYSGKHSVPRIGR